MSLNSAGNVRVHLSRQLRLFARALEHSPLDGVRFKGKLPDEQLIKNNSQSEKVRTRVHVLAITCSGDM